MSVIFLSHSSADKVFVRKIDKFLRAFGVNTFLDEKDIKVGEFIPDRIYKELENSSKFLYFISKNSLKSKWVKEELSIARLREKDKKGRFILPILIEPIKKLPAHIAHRKYVNLSNQLIDLNSLDLQLLLQELGVSNEEILKDSVNIFMDARIKTAVQDVLITISDLQVILSDINFLLRFSLETNVETISNRRFMETKSEILRRQSFDRISPLLINLKELNKLKITNPIIEDCKKRVGYFLLSLKEIFNYSPTGFPSVKLINQWAESSRYLQRGLAELQRLLLLFYFGKI